MEGQFLPSIGRGRGRNALEVQDADEATDREGRLAAGEQIGSGRSRVRRRDSGLFCEIVYCIRGHGDLGSDVEAAEEEGM